MPRIKSNATFRREKDMIAHFAKNLELLEPGLRTFGEGVEFQLFETYNGTSPRIDILAIDHECGLVVVECKVQHGHPAAVGQLAAYVQRVTENATIFRRPVRAFLVCKKASPMLWYAIRRIPNIDFTVFEYTDKDTVTKLTPPTDIQQDTP